MTLCIIPYPSQRPTMPMTPAKTGGAGTGNLNKAKTIPTPAPVSVVNKISLTIILLPKLY